MQAAQLSARSSLSSSKYDGLNLCCRLVRVMLVPHGRIKRVYMLILPKLSRVVRPKDMLPVFV